MHCIAFAFHEILYISQILQILQNLHLRLALHLPLPLASPRRSACHRLSPATQRSAAVPQKAKGTDRDPAAAAKRQRQIKAYHLSFLLFSNIPNARHFISDDLAARKYNNSYPTNDVKPPPLPLSPPMFSPPPHALCCHHMHFVCPESFAFCAPVCILYAYGTLDRLSPTLSGLSSVYSMSRLIKSIIDSFAEH